MEANVLTTGLLAKTKPEVIDSLNNGQGTFLYNHNIKEVKVIADKEGALRLRLMRNVPQARCSNMTA
mgnify:CR=1 FL=1